jgi:hypothetical protein
MATVSVTETVAAAGTPVLTQTPCHVPTTSVAGPHNHTNASVNDPIQTMAGVDEPQTAADLP